MDRPRLQAPAGGGGEPAGVGLDVTAAPDVEILDPTIEGGLFASPVVPEERWTSAAQAPRAVLVSNVFPNPSSGYVSLVVDLAAPEDIRVAVYDALGREVAVPYDGIARGRMEAMVDGSQLRPGAYLIRVLSDSFSETRTFAVAR